MVFAVSMIRLGPRFFLSAGIQSNSCNVAGMPPERGPMWMVPFVGGHPQGYPTKLLQPRVATVVLHLIGNRDAKTVIDPNHSKVESPMQGAVQSQPVLNQIPSPARNRDDVCGFDLVGRCSIAYGVGKLHARDCASRLVCPQTPDRKISERTFVCLSVNGRWLTSWSRSPNFRANSYPSEDGSPVRNSPYKRRTSATCSASASSSIHLSNSPGNNAMTVSADISARSKQSGRLLTYLQYARRPFSSCE